MGIGEAVVTVLAQLDPEQQQAMVAASELLVDDGTPVDRDSAYEKLLAKVAPAPQQDQQQGQQPDQRRRRRRGCGRPGLERVQELRAGGGERGGPGDQPVAVRHRVEGRRTTSRRRSSSGNW